MKFELPSLKYGYAELEPVIDAKTVEIHYTKHHQAYVNNLNAAMEKHPELNYNLTDLLLNIDNLPQDILVAVQNNGGGHYNHTFFWEMLTPEKNMKIGDKLKEKLENAFSSVEEFKSQFESAGLKRFGSGWVWLIENHAGKLEIITLPNQDAPLQFGKPLLGVDLWEHSYYLNYQNRRGDYLKSLWEIINWEFVESQLN